jgi:hypothetical protein
MANDPRIPASVLMTLGLAGCGLVGPCLEPPMTPCLSVIDPCSTPNPPPDCNPPADPGPKPSAADRVMDAVQPSVCLSVMPCLEPIPPDLAEEPCEANPEHPDCPPPAKVKEEVLEKDVLPDDVKKKLEEE